MASRWTTRLVGVVMAGLVSATGACDRSQGEALETVPDEVADVVPVSSEPDEAVHATVLVVTDRFQMGDGEGGALYRASLDGEVELLAEFSAAPSDAVWLDGDLWISSIYGDAVHRVDAAGDIVAAVDVGSPTHGVATDGNAVFVVTQSGEVVRIDPTGNGETARVQPPSFPSLLAAAGGALFAASTDGVLFRLDPATLEVAQTVDVVPPDERAGLTISNLTVDDRGDLWITLPHRSLIARLDNASLEVAAAALYGEPPDPGRDCASLPTCPVPATPVFLDGSDPWIYISDAAGTIDEPLVLRLDLAAGTKTSYELTGSDNALVVSDGIVWLYPGILGDVLQALDPVTGEVREVPIREADFTSGGAVVGVFDDAG